MWTIWLVDISTAGNVDRLGKIKGTDFVQFYVAGSLVQEGRADQLYDLDTVNARSKAIAPASRETLYIPIQSPQVALAFAPLATLSYSTAFLVWSALIGMLYAASCWITWKSCPALHGYRREAIACCLAFPGFYVAVLNGQLSCIGLVALAAALYALKIGRAFAAGLALGCLLYKPHWFAAAMAVFLAAREWRVTLAALVAAAAQALVTLLFLEPHVVASYWRGLRSVVPLRDALEPHTGDSLMAFFKVFAPSPPVSFVLYVCASIAALFVAARIWREAATRFEVRAAAIVFAMILINPHVLSYDLILLAPVLLLLTNWLLTNRPEGSAPARWSPRISWGVVVLFFAPIASVLPAPIHLQLSVTCMGAVLVLLWYVSLSAPCLFRPQSLVGSGLGPKCDG